MFHTSSIALGAAMILGLPASGHAGPRIWVNVEGQQVTTWEGAYPPGNPSNYSHSRVFDQPLIADQGVWYTDFPGFQQVPGGSIPTNTTFEYDITGPLLYYEPADANHPARFRTVARHFDGAPATPQFGVTNELFQSKITADGFVQGDPAFAYNGGAGDHNHLTYTLLGDGAIAGDGPDGVYVLQLRLTATGVTPSDPFFLLLGKSADDLQFPAAMFAAATLVLPGDANTDGVVNFADFQALERGFGDTDANWADGDFNADGVVDAADFLLLHDHFGERFDGLTAANATSASPVPEPASLVLVACTLGPLLVRRRCVVNILVLSCLGFIAVRASAHNPQIQIGINHNKVVTHGLFLDEPYQTPTPPQRVYQIPLGQRSLADANDGWYAEPNHAVYPYAGPGVTLIDGNFAANSILKVTFLDGLKTWNGSGFVDPGTEQIGASTVATFTPSVLTTNSGPFNSLSLAAVTATAGEHKTIRWRLLGDGVSPNTPSEDGVYLLSLQLSTDQPGIAPSDPYFFLLGKNATAADQSAALSYVNANLVPEPGALAVAGICLALALRRRPPRK
jgi:hypothetical protein